MSRQVAEVIVAGHICLDIIPAMDEKQSGMSDLLVPGKLVNIGPAVISTGGAVSNTGIALHRLGSQVKLMGKIGKDPFGEAILAHLRQQDESLVEGMILTPGEHSSYSIVISPPHTDRAFLHATGANDTYSAADVTTEQLEGARLFHFGYPPLMRSMYEHNGSELTRMLKQVKACGLTVSLDMAKPDPESDAGKADWIAILADALPYVDIFMPSFEEVLYMLNRERFHQLEKEAPSGDLLSLATGALLSELSTQLLDMGAAIVVIKLGEHGLYVRTTWDEGRLSAMGRCNPSPSTLKEWLGCEFITSCFEAEVKGTTGAGDCTIAGFLFSLLKGTSIEEAIHTAVGVGACNVEQPDATSGIPPWSDVVSRIERGWAKRKMNLDLTEWSINEQQLWIGPHDKWYRTGRDAE
ncbi:carbohydrate kinase family protein [Paenibacillus planticolens]|uniref:Carbohydrate kinase family protein n=1 Tax=Paenibacillus planticolens TaxID=2654976 RepID=A0ABX1ZZ91_9BACL|nr:carbohydrate kinase family protein [Paenibacillus planticolens]NOV04005.1 carbohydrate kinase family protein [Paenibacillus planticolens]